MIDGGPNIDLSETGKLTSNLFEDWALAVANDAIIDRKEAKDLLLDSIDLGRTLMRMRADLEARIADPATPDAPEAERRGLAVVQALSDAVCQGPARTRHRTRSDRTSPGSLCGVCSSTISLRKP